MAPGTTHVVVGAMPQADLAALHSWIVSQTFPAPTPQVVHEEWLAASITHGKLLMPQQLPATSPPANAPHKAPYSLASQPLRHRHPNQHQGSMHMTASPLQGSRHLLHASPSSAAPPHPPQPPQTPPMSHGYGMPFLPPAPPPSFTPTSPPQPNPPPMQPRQQPHHAASAAHSMTTFLHGQHEPKRARMEHNIPPAVGSPVQRIPPARVPATGMGTATTPHNNAGRGPTPLLCPPLPAKFLKKTSPALPSPPPLPVGPQAHIPPLAARDLPRMQPPSEQDLARLAQRSAAFAAAPYSIAGQALMPSANDPPIPPVADVLACPPELPSRAFVAMPPAAAHRPANASGMASLKVITYNILASCAASSNSVAHCPRELRAWSYRGPRLKRELEQYAADVYCLQEVDVLDWERDLSPWAATQGLAGLHRARPASFSMAAHKRRRSPDELDGEHGEEDGSGGNKARADGVAVLWRVERLQLVDHKGVNFKDHAEILGMGSGVWRQAVSRKDGAVACLFRLRPDAQEDMSTAPNDSTGMGEGRTSGSTGGSAQCIESWPLVCVVSTHIWFDPQTPHLKVAQVDALCRGLQEWLSPQLPPDVPLDALPMIIGGDFNATPHLERPPGGPPPATHGQGHTQQSGAYQLLSDGHLPASHPHHPSKWMPSRISGAVPAAALQLRFLQQQAGADGSVTATTACVTGSQGAAVAPSSHSDHDEGPDMGTHGLPRMVSAYVAGCGAEPPSTHRNITFEGCLDYLWTSQGPGHWRVARLLDMPYAWKSLRGRAEEVSRCEAGAGGQGRDGAEVESGNRDRGPQAAGAGESGATAAAASGGDVPLHLDSSHALSEPAALSTTPQEVEQSPATAPSAACTWLPLLPNHVWPSDHIALGAVLQLPLLPASHAVVA